MSDPSTPRFRIGDLARAAGPAVSTLRTWQERYPGLLRPTRTPGGHRLYADEDLEAVRAMQRLVAGGVTVAAAAEQVIAERDGDGSGAGKQGPGTAEDGGADPAGTAADEGADADRRAVTWWASSAGDEVEGLRAALTAARAFLHARSPAEVAASLHRLATDLGAAVRPATDAGPDALPLDLSLGTGPPTLADAPPGSDDRRRLEALLPAAVEDARAVAARLRAAERRRRSP
jgi:DNA-binding transcriptional MerR regulator